MIGVQWESGDLLSWDQKYLYGQGQAKDTGIVFGDFLSDFTYTNEGNDINVIAHSLGNRMFLEALRYIEDSEDRDVSITNYVGLAPAVNRRDLDIDVDGSDFGDLIEDEQLIQSIVITFSSGDYANFVHSLGLRTRFFGQEGGVPAGQRGSGISERITDININRVARQLERENERPFERIVQGQILDLIAISYSGLRHSGMTTQEGQWVLEQTFGYDGEFFDDPRSPQGSPQPNFWDAWFNR